MNSGFSDFQDLLNVTTSGQEIDAVKTELIALEEEVADNTANIATNATAISNNATAISNNLVLINNNTGSINTNTADISTNTGQLTFQLGLISDSITLINTNSTNITNNTANISTNDADIATNSSNISTNTSSISSKQDALTNNVQNLTTAEVSQLSNIGTSNITDVDWRGVQYLGNVQYDVNTKFNDKLNKFGDIMSGPLNMSNNDIYNPGLIGGFDLATFDSDISSLALNLGTETTRALNAEAALASDIAAINVDIPQITTNQTEIATNAADIVAVSGLAAANAAAVTLHGLDIYQNGLDITALDASKLSKSGGVMSGGLNLNGYPLWNATSVTSLGDVTVGANRYLRTDRIIPLTGTAIQLNGTTGLRANYIQSNFGTNSLNVQSNLDLNGNDLIDVGNINNASGAQINYLSGLTSDVQTQLNAKQGLIANGVASLTTSEVNQLKNIGTYVISSTAWRGAQYLTNITYDIHAEFGTKQDVLSNGVASLTTSEVNQLKNIGTYVISSTDWRGLQYMGSVTYDVNTKFNQKLSLTGGTMTGFLTTQGAHVDGTMFTASGYSGLMPGNIARKQLRIQHPFSTSYGWNIGNQASVSTSSSDMDLYFSVSRGAYGERVAAALYDQSGGTGKINFTGQHRCQPMFEFKESVVGLIVESTGRYMNFIKEGAECSQITCITINDSLPMVRLCNDAKSKKVFGVISAEEEKNRNYQVGVFASFYDKVDGDNRIYINGLGEGGIWVCNANGNLENGDYICSWSQGYGQKQDSEFLANYTVAKITMDCDFNPQLEETKKWRDGAWVMTGEFKPQYQMIELDDGMRAAFVGCTYHCS